MTTAQTPDPMGQLAAALAAAQGELRDPKRNKAGQVRGRKDYAYAGLDDVLQAVRPVLSKHGLAVTQTVDFIGERVVLRTRLIHSGGGVEESAYPLDFRGGPQERGSEVTYARRYSLEAMVGVAPSDGDDDGGAAQAQHAQGAQSTPSPSPRAEGAPPAHREPSRAAAGSGGGKTWSGHTAGAFKAMCAARGLDYPAVRDLGILKRRRPSLMDNDRQRIELVDYAQTDEGRAIYAKVVASRDNLKNKVSRMSVAARERAKDKAGLETTDVGRLTGLELKALVEADGPVQAVA